MREQHKTPLDLVQYQCQQQLCNAVFKHILIIQYHMYWNSKHAHPHDTMVIMSVHNALTSFIPYPLPSLINQILQNIAQGTKWGWTTWHEMPWLWIDHRASRSPVLYSPNWAIKTIIVIVMKDHVIQTNNYIMYININIFSNNWTINHTLRTQQFISKKCTISILYHWNVCFCVS